VTACDGERWHNPKCTLRSVLPQVSLGADPSPSWKRNRAGLPAALAC
jgi:hypothetical protein